MDVVRKMRVDAMAELKISGMDLASLVYEEAERLMVKGFEAIERHGGM